MSNRSQKRPATPASARVSTPAELESSARERIIRQVARVFRRFGYEAASLSILSRETQLGRSSLYHFFPGGKEDMALAVLDLAERFVRDDLMESLVAPDAPDRQVDRFISRLREYYEGGTVGCLYGALSLHDCPAAIGDRVAALTEQWISAIARYLTSRGDPRARESAERAVRLIQGGLIVALATRDPRRFDASLEDIRPLLLVTAA